MEGFLIWIFIMIIVGISKLVEKAKQASSGETPAQRTSRRANRPQRPSTPRPPPPVMMPSPIGEERPVVKQPRPQRRAEWSVDEDELRRFLGEVTGTEPPPLVTEPPPVPRATIPAAVRSPMAEDSVPPPVERPRQPMTEELTEPSRASQWAAAMRDPSNLRNTIIASEILGPPRAFTDW